MAPCVRDDEARVVRDGWAEASRTIAEEGDDNLVWPEFGTEDDESLEW